MKLISSTALLVSIGSLIACAAQQDAPETAESVSVGVAAELDPQTLQEIKLSAETVALAGAPTDSDGESDSDLVCRNERRPGSHISERHCYTRAALRQRSDEAQEWLRTGGAAGSITEVHSGR